MDKALQRLVIMKVRLDRRPPSWEKSAGVTGVALTRCGRRLEWLRLAAAVPFARSVMPCHMVPRQVLELSLIGTGSDNDTWLAWIPADTVGIYAV